MMFSELCHARSWARIGRKGALVALSALLHLSVILAIVVVPLVSAGSAPPVLAVSDVAVRSLAPPPVPTNKPGPKGGAKSRPKPVPERPGDTGKGDVRERGKIWIFDPKVEIDKVPDILPTDELDGRPSIIGAPEGDGSSDPTKILAPDLGKSIAALRVTHVQTPRLVKKVAPVYPEIPLRIHAQGVVVLEAITDIFGRVVDVQVKSGNPFLVEAAVNAVRQWVYEPYLVNGVPKPVRFTVTVTFALE